MKNRINPFNLTRPKPRTGIRTFTDPAQPGIELELELHSLEPTERYLGNDVGEQLITVYIGEDGTPPVKQFPPIDGRQVLLTKSLLRNVGLLGVMQGDGTTVVNPLHISEAHYTCDQLIGLAVTMPSAWNQIIMWTNELETVKTESGNDSADDTGTSSLAPSTSSINTPKLSGEQTNS